MSAINNIYAANNTILNILEIHKNLIQNGMKIEILCILSYIGIPGNEKVDQTAKDAIIHKDIHTYLEDLTKFIKVHQNQ